MENYRTGSHTRYDLKYHFVWVTKYRKKILRGEVGLRLRHLVREICLANDIEILQGSISLDAAACPMAITTRNYGGPRTGRTAGWPRR
jgi:putative transposase